MKSNYTLTFIIPIYNVENYLHQCLDSILNQPVDIEKYEILCVDDCSPDDSYLIVQKYLDKYKNIKYVKHEINKGLGAARNTGMNYAKGKYLWFIDSDDYIAPNCLPEILDLLENNELELLLFNSVRFNDNGDISNYYAYFPKTTGIISGIKYLIDDCVPHWQKPVTAWSRIHCKLFMELNHFKYPEGTFFEDEVLNLNQLLRCNSLKYINVPYYYYRLNSNSITGMEYDSKKLYDKIRVNLESLNILKEWSKMEKKLCTRISKTQQTVLYNLIVDFKSLHIKQKYELIELIETTDF